MEVSECFFLAGYDSLDRRFKFYPSLSSLVKIWNLPEQGVFYTSYSSPLIVESSFSPWPRDTVRVFGLKAN